MHHPLNLLLDSQNSCLKNSHKLDLRHKDFTWRGIQYTPCVYARRGKDEHMAGACGPANDPVCALCMHAAGLLISSSQSTLLQCNL